jgi:hypothetical protein
MKMPKIPVGKQHELVFHRGVLRKPIDALRQCAGTQTETRARTNWEAIRPFAIAPRQSAGPAEESGEVPEQSLPLAVRRFRSGSLRPRATIPITKNGLSGVPLMPFVAGSTPQPPRRESSALGGQGLPIPPGPSFPLGAVLDRDSPTVDREDRDGESASPQGPSLSLEGEIRETAPPDALGLESDSGSLSDGPLDDLFSEELIRRRFRPFDGGTHLEATGRPRSAVPSDMVPTPAGPSRQLGQGSINENWLHSEPPEPGRLSPDGMSRHSRLSGSSRAGGGQAGTPVRSSLVRYGVELPSESHSPYGGGDAQLPSSRDSGSSARDRSRVSSVPVSPRLLEGCTAVPLPPETSSPFLPPRERLPSVASSLSSGIPEIVVERPDVGVGSAAGALPPIPAPLAQRSRTVSDASDVSRITFESAQSFIPREDPVAATLSEAEQYLVNYMFARMIDGRPVEAVERTMLEEGNLTLARARELMVWGRNNVESDVRGANYEAFYRVSALKGTIASMPHLNQDHAMRAALTAYAGGGNCGEFSDLVMSLHAILLRPGEELHDLTNVEEDHEAVVHRGGDNRPNMLLDAWGTRHLGAINLEDSRYHNDPAVLRLLNYVVAAVGALVTRQFEARLPQIDADEMNFFDEELERLRERFNITSVGTRDCSIVDQAFAARVAAHLNRPSIPLEGFVAPTEPNEVSTGQAPDYPRNIPLNNEILAAGLIRETLQTDVFTAAKRAQGVVDVAKTLDRSD